MRAILFILIAISFMSCNKECNYTFSKRDYDLIPYKLNDTIEVKFINKATKEQKKAQLVVTKEELDKTYSKPPSFEECTFDRYFLYCESHNTYVIPPLGINMDKDKKYINLSFTFYPEYFYIMRPFDLENTGARYFSKITFDNKEYEDVYLMRGDDNSETFKDSLYYSSKTGLIKIIRGNNTEILFENK